MPQTSIAWPSHVFHAVLALPADYDVLDLTGGPATPRTSRYSVGRYDEDRAGMYTTPLFAGSRTVHLGIDLGAPAGTPVMAFADGVIFAAGLNAAAGDYGYVLVTEHVLDGVPLWALYGHLDARSIAETRPDQAIRAGEVLGWLGAEHENGGWPPHLHFQLSLVRPETHDLPGVVAPADRADALARYPDPRLVLGPLY